MELIPLDSKLRQAWDEFCLKSPDAWFWHTADWLDYNLAYRPELEPRSFSFLCVDGSRVLAVAPLLVTSHEQDGRRWSTFSLCGNALPSPALDGALSSAERDDVLDFIFRGIDDAAEELGVAYARFRIEALRPAVLKPRYAPWNFLLQYGFVDSSVNTQLIDLRLSRTELRDGLRRNHQRSIDAGRDLFRIKIHSGSDLTNEKFDEYVRMHARAAGRVTRPRATFDLMRTWIQSGRGLVVEAVANDGKTAGFELYIMYKKAAYGLSACNEPEFKHLPIRHLIEWEAMSWMKKQGVEFYEIGPQLFGALPYDFPEKKNLDISRFKYGFGGATVPSFHAERFYCAEHWRSEQLLRNERFADRYAWKRAPRGEEGRAMLRRIERPSEPACAKMEENSAPIPPELLGLAEAVIRQNPEGVKKFAEGNVRLLHFFVGKVLRAGSGALDPNVLRRAIEQKLAEIIAGAKET